MTWFDKSLLPSIPDDYKSLEVELETLESNVARGCPVSSEDIDEYLKMEAANPDEVGFHRLEFVRTAAINDGKAWIWRFNDDDGESYLTVVERGGACLLSAHSNYLMLSPEQEMLATYFSFDDVTLPNP